jgi:acrylyl-CoA reductase (NADPH)
MKALVLDQIDNRTVATVKDIDLPALAEGDVRVAIDWSSLNYKDALAITGKGKIIRQFPMVPGIDFAGQVKESRDPRFVPGQAVILTGWGVGENHWGGLATEACVKGDWLVALPETLSARQAMIIGTAGFTAMLCVDALVSAGITPKAGISWSPAPAAGRQHRRGVAESAWLPGDGRIGPGIDTRLPSPAGRRCDPAAQRLRGDPSAGETAVGGRGGYRWRPGAGQSAGANAISRLRRRLRSGRGLRSADHRDAVYSAQCASAGVDSVMVPTAERDAVWQRLAQLLPESYYQQAATEITLEQAPAYAADFLSNNIHGRTLVNIGQ